MPLMKKTKKGKRKAKDSGKLKSAKSGGTPLLLPPELRGLDTEWWYTFLHKHAESGLSAPSDEGEAFRYFFRTSRKTFDYICSIVREDLITRPPSGLINIEGRLLSVEKQVAIATRRLASGDSQASVAAAFGVRQSTVSQVTWRFIESMEERARHHLVWPGQERMEEIKAKFEAASALPNCCGAIDATHIIMQLPAVQSSEDWCDPAKNYSMFLQGIVDDEMRFIDIATGPGSMTFSRLLKCSGFFKLCEAGKRLDGPVKVSAENAEMGEFIAGDVCYPLLPWLMTPYEGKSLSAPMVNFNARQKAARMIGTKALARLKGSWRILHKAMFRPDKHKLPSIILVCCLLHNIIIDCKDELLPDVQLPEHHDTGYNEENCKQVDPNGKVMREIITGEAQGQTAARERGRKRRGMDRKMLPVKKSMKGKRKAKDSGKLKSAKSGGAPLLLPPELRSIDTEWWYTFLHKHAESGLSAPSDEGEAFKYFFRTSRKTFDYICSIVREDLISRPPSGLINIEGRLLSVEKQVAIATRRLASGDSQASVGAAFGVRQSTVSQVTWRFIESMEERARHHLVWPGQERMEEIKAKFEAVSGLPNCCGAIDATHIIMTLPAVRSSEDWCDPAKNYSMFVQGIVDDEMRFIDIATGPGSMTFSRLLKCSGFFKLCEAGQLLDGPVKVSAENAEMEEFIAGDVCYPLLPWLMIPYKGKSLSAPMVNFNARQKAARTLGTKALARLKGSWRILHKVMFRPDKHKLPSIILVCCLLHNIIIDCKDELLPDVQLPEHHDTGYNEENCEQVDPYGKVRREIITEEAQGQMTARERGRRWRGMDRKMPPMKKSMKGKPMKKSMKGKRKAKDSGKLKTAKSGGTPAPLPQELRGLDMEWWYTFLRKHAESGLSAPSDEGEAFRYFFRTSRKTFDYICSIVREDLISRPPSGLINIEGRLLSVEKQVAIATRRLASGDSQASVGAAFGVRQSTVSQVTWRFIESMEARARHHLVWPDQERMEEIKAKFEAASGLPNCCGAIDATHIIMQLPAVQSSEDWCDPVKKYSMFLQGIVDDEMRFIDIATGPGSMTFSRLLKCSGFFKLCEAGKGLDGPVKVSAENAEMGEFIAGDVCYPLLPWLMTPYEGKSLSAAMVNFNVRQKAARMIGTKALARLKGLWRILHKVMFRPDKHKLPSIILVCCLLHNIIIDCKDELLPDVQLPEHHDTGYSEENCEQVDPNGKVMREIITGHLQSYEASN